MGTAWKNPSIHMTALEILENHLVFVELQDGQATVSLLCARNLRVKEQTRSFPSSLEGMGERTIGFQTER
jgi:hypothetical protein